MTVPAWVAFLVIFRIACFKECRGENLLEFIWGMGPGDPRWRHNSVFIGNLRYHELEP